MSKHKLPGKETLTHHSRGLINDRIRPVRNCPVVVCNGLAPAWLGIEANPERGDRCPLTDSNGRGMNHFLRAVTIAERWIRKLDG